MIAHTTEISRLQTVVAAAEQCAVDAKAMHNRTISQIFALMEKQADHPTIEALIKQCDHHAAADLDQPHGLPLHRCTLLVACEDTVCCTQVALLTPCVGATASCGLTRHGPGGLA